MRMRKVVYNPQRKGRPASAAEYINAVNEEKGYRVVDEYGLVHTYETYEAYLEDRKKMLGLA